MNLMDAKLKTLIEKLSKPHWMDTDPRTVVSNLTPEHIGQLNLMWVMLNRKPITQGFFDLNLTCWSLAGQVSSIIIDKFPVLEYATLFDEQEFYQFVLKHPKSFSTHIPMSRWRQMFRHRQT